MKHLFVKRGLVQEFLDRDARRLPKESGFFDMQKWIKRIFNFLHVPYVDPCCDADKMQVPVQYNAETGNIEAYDLATDVWIAIDTGSTGTNFKWVEITASSTIPSSQRYTLVDTTAGDVAVTLPNPTTATGSYVIKKSDAVLNDVTFTQTIDGDSNFVLNAQYESVTVMSNGTSYYTM